jgi:hypothetical protein
MIVNPESNVANQTANTVVTCVVQKVAQQHSPERGGQSPPVLAAL